MIATIIITCLICGCVACGIYNRASGFFLGLFFGPIGIIIAAILSLDPDYKAEAKAAELERQKQYKDDLAKWDEETQRLYLAGVSDAQTKQTYLDAIKPKINEAVNKHWQELKQSGKAWN